MEDVLAVKHERKATSKRTNQKKEKKGIKVVYISSPMKVKTSASNFRDIVQELTGRDSDAERYMENINGGGDQDRAHHDGGQFLDPSLKRGDQFSQLSNTSQSFLGPLESAEGGGFSGTMMFQSFFNEPVHMEGLRSFGAM